MKLASLLGHTYEVLQLYFTTGKPADHLIDTFFRSRKYLGSRDRRFIAETAYGVLRHLRFYQYAAEQALGESYRMVSEEKQLSYVIAAYLASGSEGDAVTFGAIEEFIRSKNAEMTVKDFPTKIQGCEIPQAVDQAGIGLRYSFPDWMVRRFVDAYGLEGAEKLCASLNDPPSVTLRVNLLKTSVAGCQQRLEKEGIATERTPISPFGLILKNRLNVLQLQSFREGFFEVQDEGSQLLPLLIDLKSTDKVLDACAGAGGKTLELAALMKNRGEIIAADVNEFRLKELKKRARRARAFNIRTKVIDFSNPVQHEDDLKFDVVLVDAPCTGVGTIRRNPGMKWSVTESSVEEISQKQLAILSHASEFVKSEGLLVYATCTLFREENEDVIERFLLRFPHFTIHNPTVHLKRVRLDALKADPYIRLLPHIHGTDGFFCAFMRKKGESYYREL